MDQVILSVDKYGSRAAAHGGMINAYLSSFEAAAHGGMINAYLSSFEAAAHGGMIGTHGRADLGVMELRPDDLGKDGDCFF